ncbi:MAG TPA: hypothetical protein VGC65_08470 [Bacteroidia bacterium]|jgi:hypothetical protein
MGKKILIGVIIGVLIMLPSQVLPSDHVNEGERIDAGERTKDDGVSWVSILIIGGVICWVWQGGWMKKNDEK